MYYFNGILLHFPDEYGIILTLINHFQTKIRLLTRIEINVNFSKNNRITLYIYIYICFDYFFFFFFSFQYISNTDLLFESTGKVIISGEWGGKEAGSRDRLPPLPLPVEDTFDGKSFRGNSSRNRGANIEFSRGNFASVLNYYHAWPV